MYLPIMLNSIVHVLVYLHYVLTALGKQSWSWWSRHLTKLQLAQFVVRFCRLCSPLSLLTPSRAMHSKVALIWRIRDPKTRRASALRLQANTAHR